MFNLQNIPDITISHIDLPPISELHVHAEGGTLNRETVEYLAKQNNLPFPEDLFTANNSIRFKEKDFIDFLRVYDQLTRFIITASDITYVTYQYLRRCHEEGAIYIELTCSPDHLKLNRVEYENPRIKNEVSKANLRNRGLTYSEFVDAIAEGIAQAQKEFGIEARILMVLLRHNGKTGCQETLDDILSYRHPYVVGINLAGDEERFPAQDFQELYKKARENGLKCTAHIGEHTSAEIMWEAINTLQPHRIGHGISCLSDTKLINYLKENQLGLELSPGSNIGIGICESYEQHPGKELFRQGIKISINSDDPTYFATTLKNEFQQVQQAWGLTNEDLLKIYQDSIKDSFAEKSLKTKLLARINIYESFTKLDEQLTELATLDTASENEQLQKLLNQFAEYKKAPNATNAQSLYAITSSIPGQFSLTNQLAYHLVNRHSAYNKAHYFHQLEIDNTFKSNNPIKTQNQPNPTFTHTKT